MTTLLCILFNILPDYNYWQIMFYTMLHYLSVLRMKMVGRVIQTITQLEVSNKQYIIN